jgi:hypothetical protein
MFRYVRVELRRSSSETPDQAVGPPGLSGASLGPGWAEHR